MNRAWMGGIPNLPPFRQGSGIEGASLTSRRFTMVLLTPMDHRSDFLFALPNVTTWAGRSADASINGIEVMRTPLLLVPFTVLLFGCGKKLCRVD